MLAANVLFLPLILKDWMVGEVSLLKQTCVKANDKIALTYIW
jgi:hypothetical protein